MAGSSIIGAQSPTLFEASLALSRCRTEDEVVVCIEHTLQQLPDLIAYDVAWLAQGRERSLAALGGLIPRPGPRARAQMAAGQIAETGAEINYIPLIARDSLQGWITLQIMGSLDLNWVTWGAHCAAALLAAAASDEALAGHIRDLEQRNEQLAEVVKIGNALRSTFSVEELTGHIVQTMHALTGAPRVILGVVDTERTRLRLAAIFGFADPARARREHRMSLQQMEDLIGRGRSIGTFTYEIERDPLLPMIEDAMVMAIRRAGGELVGTIVLDLGSGHAPLAADLIRTLEIVANQAGIALNNAVLYTEQQQTVDRLTALNALSLAVSTSHLPLDTLVNMAIAGAVGTTGGTLGGAIVATPEARVGQLVTHYGASRSDGVEPSWIDSVASNAGDYTLIGSDQIPAALVERGIQHILVVPLRGAKLLIGTLWIGYSQTAPAQAERELAVLYAKMAGAVIENMYLVEAVRNAHDRLASIISSTREGMLLIGADHHVAMANPAFIQLLGLERVRIQGRGIEELSASDELQHLPRELRQSLCDALLGIIDGSLETSEGEWRLPLGAERDITWHALPVRATTSDANGVLLVIRDVTADRQMERMRQDLANMIVHDLRSPLTNMMVSVDLLLKRTTGPLTESQARILSIASSSCQQMLDLVNALLDIRRLEQRTRELQCQPVDLADIADIVFERLERTAEDRRITLRNEVATTKHVCADPDMIRRVLQNLVDNALKFSAAGGSVMVRADDRGAQELNRPHAAGEWIMVEVQDWGIGIAEEYHQVIFELFAQAPDGQGRGTGLGLAFCKLAVEAHGGKIWVESAPGRGASFFFTLPAAR